MKTAVNLAAYPCLAALFGITAYALLGPHAIHGPVPTHFNVAGQADAWGSPVSLWVLPVIATFLFILMTLVSRFPESFNFPVRVTAANRARLEGIALSMIAWLRLEVVALMTIIQAGVIRSVQQGRTVFAVWVLPVSLIVIFGTIGLHFVRILRDSPRKAA